MYAATTPILTLAPLRFRVFAFVIDIIILSVCFASFKIAAQMFVGDFDKNVFGIIRVVWTAFYFIGFIYSPLKATPGQMLMEIGVVRADNGEMLSFAQASLRYVILFLGAFLSLLYAIAIGEQAYGPAMKPLQPNAGVPTFSNIVDNLEQDRFEGKTSQVEPTPEQLLLEAIKDKIDENEPLTKKEQDFLKELQTPRYKEMFAGVLSSGRTLFELLMLGYTLALLVSIVKGKQIGWHDRLTNTRVVRLPRALAANKEMT